MPFEVQDSIQALVEYLYEEERRHWEESGRPAAHIFSHVTRVADWLESLPPATKSF